MGAVVVEIVTTGAMASPAPTDHVNDLDADNVPSETDAVTAWLPAAVGVPAMRPLDVLSETPVGSPVAE